MSSSEETFASGCFELPGGTSASLRQLRSCLWSSRGTLGHIHSHHRKWFGMRTSDPFSSLECWEMFSVQGKHDMNFVHELGVFLGTINST